MGILQSLFCVVAQSVAAGNPVDQFLNAGHKTIFVKGIAAEFKGVVAGKHQIVFQRAAMGDVLKGFLDTERARIGPFSGRAFFALGPVGEPAL